MDHNLQTSFYFSVSITGMCGSDAAFQEVSGLSKELGIEEVVCGGENRFKYRLPAQTSFQNLVLRRGVVNAESALIGWVKDTLDNGLSAPIKTRDIKVWLLDENGHISMDWNFIAAWPVKWSASNLRSQESEIFIETLEFAYQYFDMPNFDTY
ncbi:MULTISPECIES: phage tail protein [Phytobacter]|uniref:Phage tail protein n=1 Tax=Phytobacter diazotrophicus TaxID=395631 RepID=A0ABM7VVN5_9ENTR|nr:MULTISPECIES: phage tail protein [Phytobacter]MDU4152306.1 phage tail protein [Enterobacteriaceae bacterium]MDU7378177.1 phage tail protein [Enterobacteriaceae bacterium]BBE77744.1 phage tail protein [Phytobacter sp. MRY16-398]BDD51113.1 phage tail protein [Phytobacter diazotrophicus]BEG82143.1 phage tail protein [Phytobacter diazotrophicus]